MLQPYIESATALSDMFVIWRFLIFKMSLIITGIKGNNLELSPKRMLFLKII